MLEIEIYIETLPIKTGYNGEIVPSDMHEFSYHDNTLCIKINGKIFKHNINYCFNDIIEVLKYEKEGNLEDYFRELIINYFTNDLRKYFIFEVKPEIKEYEMGLDRIVRANVLYDFKCFFNKKYEKNNGEIK